MTAVDPHPADFTVIPRSGTLRVAHLEVVIFLEKPTTISTRP